MRKKQTILFHVIFAVLCASSLFCTQVKVHDALIQSKWFAFYFIVPILAFLFSWQYKGYIRFRVADMIVCVVVLYFSVHNLQHDNIVEFWTNLCSILSLYYILRLRNYCFSFNIVAWIMLSCSIVLSVWGASQISTWDSLLSNITFTGPFESCAAYALSLVLCFPFIIYLFLHEQKCRPLIVMVLLLSITMIILTKSRMAWLSALISGFFLYICTKCPTLTIKPIIKWLLPIIIGVLFLLYFIRPVSANGRLFIWFNTFLLYLKNPVLGHGYNTFRRDYMTQQADFFRIHPDSNLSMIADNISHPFNEYLYLLVQWGALGFLLFGILVVFLLIAWKKERKAGYDTMISCLMVIAVSSCFSYPFFYPFTWIIFIYCISNLAGCTNVIGEYRSCLPRFISVCVVGGVGLYGAIYHYQRKWYEVTNLYKQSPPLAIQQYKTLYPHLCSDPYFLYSYSVVLYEEACYEESIQLLEECSILLNDYDVQMLRGAILCNLKSYDEALACFELAADMCPSKFMPLYQAFETMKLCGREDKAIELCKEIMDKPIKVDSEQVKFIKAKCHTYYNTFFINN